MSTLPENELDLEKLLLPAWAQEPASAKHYAQYEGGDDRPERQGERRGRKPFRPGGPGGPGDRPRGDRPRGDRRGGPPRREGERRQFDGPQSGPRRNEPRERREPPPPLPEINTAFVPDQRGVESLARQIKTTGRAYPLFDIARLILQKPERFAITFSTKKKPDGQVAQPLFSCALDETLWLSEDEAVQHVLKHHFGTFYQAERTATEPPKGKYTFVAQCGLSGIILGPPNHHDYQNQLRKLHADRFSRMPFEVFKARVRIVRDDAVVKKWIEDQSFKTEFVCLNMPEPLRLAGREDVELHFRQTHKDNIIKAVESQTLNGAQARSLRSPELARLVRQACEDQRHFPLQIATVLSQQFAGCGLQFFKVNKAVTHVCVARPHFLDTQATPVSDGVKRIVEFLNATPKCTRRRLMEALAPTPKAAPAPPASVAPPAEPAASPAAEGQSTTPAEAPAAPPASPAPAQPEQEPTPEQTAVIGDLHWLIHQGHVIEFANGLLETAKKPLPRPPKPEAKPAQPSAQPVPEAAATETAAAETVTAPPVVPETEPAASAEPPAAPAVQDLAQETALPESTGTVDPPPADGAQDAQS